MADRYTVIYDGDPTGVRVLNGEAAPGRAVGVCSGDIHAQLRQTEVDLAALRAEAEAKSRRIAELEEALAPFAAARHNLPSDDDGYVVIAVPHWQRVDVPHDWRILRSFLGEDVMVGDLRHAARLLGQEVRTGKKESQRLQDERKPKGGGRDRRSARTGAPDDRR